MLKLYLDDSKDKDSLVVMAGYIAHEEMWETFVAEWSRALREAGVKVFHATDFFNARGEFKGWNLKSKRHRNFSRRFTAIAESQATLAVCRGIHLDVFREVIAAAPEILRRTPHGRLTPMMWCARSCLEWISISGPQHGRPLDEPIAVIIERGPGTPEVLEYLSWLKERGAPWMDCFCSFEEGDKSLLPLQGADLIAHETKRRLVEYVKPDGRPIRKSLHRLLKRRMVEMNLFQRTDKAIQYFVGLDRELKAGNPEVIAMWEGTAGLHRASPTTPSRRKRLHAIRKAFAQLNRTLARLLRS